MVPTDVNGDGITAPNDALYIINYVNDSENDVNSKLPTFRSEATATPPFYDVNQDYFVTHIDALRVINKLNESEDGQKSAALKADTGIPIPLPGPARRLLARGQYRESQGTIPSIERPIDGNQFRPGPTAGPHFRRLAENMSRSAVIDEKIELTLYLLAEDLLMQSNRDELAFGSDD